MNPQEELEIISNALTFLQRTDIKGNEVQAFVGVQNYLNEKGTAINTSLQMSPPVADDEIVDAVVS